MTKLLLVSSDSQSCQPLQQVLEQECYDVVTTHRGGEGLRLATAALPDLILLDMAMSVVNGWQIIQVLKKASATKQIPVIAMANPTVDGQRLLQAGFDTYVRKPVSFRSLSLKIRTLLSAPAANDDRLPNVQISTPISLIKKIPCSQQQLDHARVVYVDDAPEREQAGVKIIQRAGYGCVRIPDALQDLSQLLDLMPQLIFIDLAPPVGNSYELCAQIRRISQFAATPLIVVTDNDSIVDQVRARLAGASGFISKPFKTRHILQVLMKHLLYVHDMT
ncbi:MAG: response regulator [Cyanobacteria bacterium P01_A01_bin.137]